MNTLLKIFITWRHIIRDDYYVNLIPALADQIFIVADVMSIFASTKIETVIINTIGNTLPNYLVINKSTHDNDSNKL